MKTYAEYKLTAAEIREENVKWWNEFQSFIKPFKQKILASETAPKIAIDHLKLLEDMLAAKSLTVEILDDVVQEMITFSPVITSILLNSRHERVRVATLAFVSFMAIRFNNLFDIMVKDLISHVVELLSDMSVKVQVAARDCVDACVHHCIFDIKDFRRKALLSTDLKKRSAAVLVVNLACWRWERQSLEHEFEGIARGLIRGITHELRRPTLEEKSIFKNSVEGLYRLLLSFPEKLQEVYRMMPEEEKVALLEEYPFLESQCLSLTKDLPWYEDTLCEAEEGGTEDESLVASDIEQDIDDDEDYGNQSTNDIVEASGANEVRSYSSFFPLSKTDKEELSPEMDDEQDFVHVSEEKHESMPPVCTMEEEPRKLAERKEVLVHANTPSVPSYKRRAKKKRGYSWWMLVLAFVKVILMMSLGSGVVATVLYKYHRTALPTPVVFWTDTVIEAVEEMMVWNESKGLAEWISLFGREELSVRQDEENAQREQQMDALVKQNAQLGQLVSRLENSLAQLESEMNDKVKHLVNEQELERERLETDVRRLEAQLVAQEQYTSGIIGDLVSKLEGKTKELQEVRMAMESDTNEVLSQVSVVSETSVEEQDTSVHDEDEDVVEDVVVDVVDEQPRVEDEMYVENEDVDVEEEGTRVQDEAIAVEEDLHVRASDDEEHQWTFPRGLEAVFILTVAAAASVFKMLSSVTFGDSSDKMVAVREKDVARGSQPLEEIREFGSYSTLDTEASSRGEFCPVRRSLRLKRKINK